MSRVNVFVLIDALGWELVAQRPFLAQYLPHQQEVRTLLGYSSGIIPSILTGQTPAENGVWNLVYYDPARSPFRHMKHLGTLPGRLLDNRYGRRARQRAAADPAVVSLGGGPQHLRAAGNPGAPQHLRPAA